MTGGATSPHCRGSSTLRKENSPNSVPKWKATLAADVANSLHENELFTTAHHARAR